MRPAPPQACIALLALTACKTTTTGLPTWDDPDPGSPVAAADDDSASDVVLPGSDPAPPSDPGSASEADPDPDPTTPEDPPSSASAPADPAQPDTLELPAPIHRKVESKCGKDPGVGQRLKAFSLPSADGKTIKHTSYRGRVLVVNFWGTWCKPCLKELPEFDQLYRRYRKHGMTLLAIATDEDPKAVNDFKAKRRLAAKLAIAGEAYAGQYSSSQFPFTFVVDPRGVIKSSYRGYKPECMGKLEADIREELIKRSESRAAK